MINKFTMLYAKMKINRNRRGKMTHFDIIKDAVNFNYNSQRYVELRFVAKMTGIPKLVIKNVLEQMGFIESGIPGQYIKA